MESEEDPRKLLVTRYWSSRIVRNFKWRRLDGLLHDNAARFRFMIPNQFALIASIFPFPSQLELSLRSTTDNNERIYYLELFVRLFCVVLLLFELVAVVNYTVGLNLVMDLAVSSYRNCSSNFRQNHVWETEPTSWIGNYSRGHSRSFAA